SHHAGGTRRIRRVYRWNWQCRSFRLLERHSADSAGNVYVTDLSYSTIRTITPAGVVTTLAGTAGIYGSADGTGSAAQFDYPWGIAVDSTKNLYVSDQYNQTIRKITPTGVVTTLGGVTGRNGIADGTGRSARFFTPAGIAVA